MNTTKYLEIGGTKVPYTTKVATTVLTEEGATLRASDPQYIVNLKRWQENGSLRALSAAVLSIQKEVLLSLLRGMADTYWCYEAPTNLNGSVPPGHVWVDYKSGRIVLNPEVETTRFIDFDGDRACLVFNEERTMAVLVKFPITSPPSILTLMDHPPIQEFSGISSEQAEAIKAKAEIHYITAENLEEYFQKKHEGVPVGLLTSSWNSRDLFVTQDMPLEERLQTIFNTEIDPETGHTRRAIELEQLGMKQARKEGSKAPVETILTYGPGVTLKDQYAWALTSASGIGDMRPEQFDWMATTDLNALVDDILNLKVEFRKVKAPKKFKRHDSFVEGSLLDRLLDMGLIEYVEIPHADKNMPPAIMLFLTFQGEIVALTDVKRDNQKEGLTYGFLIPPIWDNYTIWEWNPDIRNWEVSIPPRKEWVHPIDHLGKCLTTFDTRITAPDGRITGYFPKYEPHWQNPFWDWCDTKRAVKVAKLQKFITDWASEYGDAAPCLRTNHGISPTSMAKATIMRTVTIDYGEDMKWEEMFKVAQEAHKTCNFCLPGSKSDNARIRKYMLAGEHGKTILDSKGTTSPYRGACQRSQLLRALKDITMTVAIVETKTGSSLTANPQVFITPSGVEKQITDTAFMPQVFNTEEEYIEHLQQHNATPDEIPAETVDYTTWTGERRRCWTVGAKGTIRIGKLIDFHGSKFMGAYMPQVVGLVYGENGVQTTEEIDILYPLAELEGKDLVHEFLADAVEMDIVLPRGETIPAMVTKRRFFRTGAASENVPARFRYSTWKAMDRLPIRVQVGKIKSIPPQGCREEFMKLAQELQQAASELRVLLPVVSPEEEE